MNRTFDFSKPKMIQKRDAESKKKVKYKRQPTFKMHSTGCKSCEAKQVHFSIHILKHVQKTDPLQSSNSPKSVLDSPTFFIYVSDFRWRKCISRKLHIQGLNMDPNRSVQIMDKINSFQYYAMPRSSVKIGI